MSEKTQPPESEDIAWYQAALRELRHQVAALKESVAAQRRAAEALDIENKILWKHIREGTTPSPEASANAPENSSQTGAATPPPPPASTPTAG